MLNVKKGFSQNISSLKFLIQSFWFDNQIFQLFCVLK